MATAKIKIGLYEFQFEDADVCNPDDFNEICLGDGWSDWMDASRYPGEKRIWIIHNEGFVQAVVISDNLDDAYEIAAESGKLEHFAIQDSDVDAMDDKEVDRLNVYNGKFYDLEGLSSLSAPVPRRLTLCETLNYLELHGRS